MILNKWNWKKHKYEPYKIPDEWNCSTYSISMEQEVNCPQCGRIIKFEDSYVSREIHTEVGFGYAVCKSCYEKEWIRYKEANGEEK